jgi:hypothetical protein
MIPLNFHIFLGKMKNIFFILLAVLTLQGCYTFRDATIPSDVKTIKVNLIENRAQYINPQLAPQLTDRLIQKINNQTRLTLIQGDADYEITATIRNYMVTTAGVSNQQAATNRLVVSVHLNLLNRVNPKGDIDDTITRNFDFSATLSLQQAEAQLMEDILKGLTDEIFNRIFSNW